MSSHALFPRILCRTGMLLRHAVRNDTIFPKNSICKFALTKLVEKPSERVTISLLHTSSFLQKSKGKKGKKMEVIVDPRDASEYIDLNAVLRDMTKAVERLKNDYVHDFRVGVDTNSLTNIDVNLEGMKVKLQEVAAIQRKSEKSIELDFVSFPEALKPAMLAIQSSSLNLSPSSEGTKVHVPIPAITAEHRKGLAKNAKLRLNESKEELKKIRNSHEKKLKSFENLSQDMDRAIRKQIGVYAETSQTEAEKAFKAKEKDLLLQ